MGLPTPDTTHWAAIGLPSKRPGVVESGASVWGSSPMAVLWRGWERSLDEKAEHLHSWKISSPTFPPSHLPSSASTCRVTGAPPSGQTNLTVSCLFLREHLWITYRSPGTGHFGTPQQPKMRSGKILGEKYGQIWNLQIISNPVWSLQKATRLLVDL